MDDLDFYQALRGPSRDAEACLRSLVKKAAVTPKLKKPPPPKFTAQEIQAKMAEVIKRMKKVKTAGAVSDAANMAKAWALAHQPELIGAAVGGTTMGAYGYLVNRKRAGKPTVLEQAALDELASHKRSTQELKDAKRTPGLTHKMRGVFGRAFADAAKTMKDHPGAAAALYGGLGASTGAGLARAGTELLNEVRHGSLE